MKLLSTSLLSLVAAPIASAALIVDFTTAGNNGTDRSGLGFVFASQDPTGTGVAFTITASAVIPGGGGANNGDIFRQNGGLGSKVENTGGFVNNIGTPAVPEVLEFTISGVTGLGAGETLQLLGLLSQNGNSIATNQSGGYGGAFGQQVADSVTLESDTATTIVINQSDLGDKGAILLNNNNNNNTNTGNTFLHAGALDFTDSFTLRLTDLTANEAIVVQGFEFAVVPEPSTSLMAFGSLGLLFLRRRRP